MTASVNALRESLSSGMKLEAQVASRDAIAAEPDADATAQAVATLAADHESTVSHASYLPLSNVRHR